MNLDPNGTILLILSNREQTIEYDGGHLFFQNFKLQLFGISRC